MTPTTAHITAPHQGIDAVALVGFLASFALLFCYLHQHLGRRFIVGCAIAGSVAATYGFVQGAWPLGMVMAAWSALSLRRAFARKPQPAPATVPERGEKVEWSMTSPWQEASRLDRLFGKK